MDKCKDCKYYNGILTGTCRPCGKRINELNIQFQTRLNELMIKLKLMTEKRGIGVSETISEYIKEHCPTLYTQILQDVMYELEHYRKEVINEST